jgi:AraC family transcriptional regulator, alkane utilization regulator
MTATPPSFAKTPPTDVLADMLRAVRLTGACFLKASFTEPFGVFHLITANSCMIETTNGHRQQLNTGDIALLPFVAEHKLWRGDRPNFVPASQVVARHPKEGVWSFSHGGGGTETQMICGFIESAELMASPMFRSLPELVIERAGDHMVDRGIASTIGALTAQVESLNRGAEVVLGRMMETLFVEILRRHVEQLPPGTKGVLGALNDPVVGRALQLLHAEPARRWTADALAREAGSSRTVLGERFNALLGKPPIEYLTSWRIQLAADRLRNSSDSISRIALDYGYESEPAFNRAFKRVTGMTPGRWRDGGGDSPPNMPLYFKEPLGPPSSA